MAIGKTGKEQTKLEILESYKFFKRDVESMEELLLRQRARVESCTSKMETCSAGILPKDKISEYLEVWETVFDEWKSRVDMQKNKMLICDNIIEKLPEEKLKLIMRLYYIDGLKWYDISNSIGYSIEHCWRLHAQAKRILEKDDSQ